MSSQFDIAIVGSGFSGSLMALVCRQLGHSVVLLEKGSHPRVVVGESSTPLSNLLLEELASKYDLPMLKPFAKWGSWQQTYPQLACGLKRGFSFFHHDLTHPAKPQNRVDHQLLVAASPQDHIGDTHWFRADFDQFLVQQAQQLGVEYFDHLNIHACTCSAPGWSIQGLRNNQAVRLQATFLIDATGPRGFLHRTLQLQEQPLRNFPATSSLGCHFTGVRKLQDLGTWPVPGAPYPPDDAALHHVFDGGWIWILHFNNGWTSAGMAATGSIADRFQLREGEAAWYRILQQFPIVKEQFSTAEPQTPFHYQPALSFLSSSIAADKWAMLPSAAGFVDPLLSTGIPLTLVGISHLAEILGRDWNSKRLATTLQSYALATRRHLQTTATLIGALYHNMSDFPFFRSLSLLYFAAASYTETARRLGKPQLAPGFLLDEDPVFGPEYVRLLSLSMTSMTHHAKATLQEDIYGFIDRFDVAGICKRPPDHCYPVEASDLFASAYKLGASAKDIEALLQRSGLLLGAI